MPGKPVHLGLIGMLACAGCEPLGSFQGYTEDTALVSPDPLVVAYPTVIDFGEVPVTGEPVLATLTLENPSSRPIMVYGHDQPIGLYGEDTSVFTFGADSLLELAPREQKDIEVGFLPKTDGRWDATLNIHPGDHTIEVIGDGKAPILGMKLEYPDYPENSPPAIGFGCQASVQIDLYNQGRGALEITDLAFTDNPQASWSLPEATLPTVLVDGQHLYLEAVFAPEYAEASGGPQTAWLTVQSNDPATPVLDLPLHGVALPGPVHREQFSYSPPHKVDLLVVADTRASVRPHLPKVSSALRYLAWSLDELGVELNSAVVTGSTSCPLTDPQFADPDTDLEERSQLFQDGLDGPPGDGSTSLGEHASAAVTAASTGTCLDGFIRPRARLHVVLVSGNPDQSGYSGMYQLGTLESAAAESDVVVHTIQPTAGESCGSTTYAGSYEEMRDASDGQAIDICLDDLTDDIADVATAEADQFPSPNVHPLAFQPIEASIHLTVDGEAFTDFCYDSSNHTLVFGATTNDTAEGGCTEAGSVDLDPDTVVEIVYMRQEDC